LRQPTERQMRDVEALIDEALEGMTDIRVKNVDVEIARRSNDPNANAFDDLMLFDESGTFDSGLSSEELVLTCTVNYIPVVSASEGSTSVQAQIPEFNAKVTL
jgi:hypothetical protein